MALTAAGGAAEGLDSLIRRRLLEQQVQEDIARSQSLSNMDQQRFGLEQARFDTRNELDPLEQQAFQQNEFTLDALRNPPPPPGPTPGTLEHILSLPPEDREGVLAGISAFEGAKRAPESEPQLHPSVIALNTEKALSERARRQQLGIERAVEPEEPSGPFTGAFGDIAPANARALALAEPIPINPDVTTDRFDFGTGFRDTTEPTLTPGAELVNLATAGDAGARGELQARMQKTQQFFSSKGIQPTPQQVEQFLLDGSYEQAVEAGVLEP